MRRALQKVGAAIIAVVTTMLTFAFLDAFPIVRGIGSWVIAAITIAAIYTCLVDGPRAFVRIWLRTPAR